MRFGRWVTVLALVATLAGCGGGGTSTGSTVSSGGTGSGSSGTIATTTGCSLRERQDWAAAQIREWNLFPDTLPATLDPSPYTTVGDYIDALTATARTQRKDRYFTYLTSIAAENAYYASGSSAGFGFRLSTQAATQRAFVSEVFEGTAALAAGLDRGTEILAIGTSSSTLRTVSAIIAAEGTAGVSNALGDSTAGLVRTLRVTDGTTTRDVTMTKTDYTLTPISSRYGAQVINDGGRMVGYVNLRTFISTADDALRSAFQTFKAQGITNVIVDLRYNGGGLVATAQLFGDLLGGARTTAQVQGYTTFRPEKASNNETRYYQTEAQAIAPARIAFIGTAGTASASEYVINATIPYLHAASALIGTNTYGKPVGQIALDRSQCDDRLRLIAFAIENSAHQGAYYDGLVGTVEASCQATDDIAHAMGSPQEASTRQALDFLAGRSCTAISAGQSAQAYSAETARRDLLTPAKPSVAQRDVPGLF